ncbi:MAG: ATP-binding cassette domain-containing protein [Acidobacteria bacterium]|nr:ATP-binding cassette domain-containing protein [Acidobacteriota bacterium]
MRTARGALGPLATALALAAGAAVLRIPAGIVALGLLLGALSSLTALGLVLIYRTHRFLNLAHSASGLVAGAAVAQLVSAGGWSFWVAAPAGIATGIALGLAAEAVLVGRLGRAPRALPLVASLGLAQAFAGGRAALAFAFGTLPFYSIPLRASFDVFPIRFGGAHVLAALAAPLGLAALALFLRRTRAGVASRALAENEERARALGVPVRSVSRQVWAVAGALAAAGGILTVPIAGISLEAGASVGPLLLALAPAAVAGMRSLPKTLGASLAIGVLYQGALWKTDRAAVADLLLFAIALGAAAARRPKSRREEEALAASSWVLAAPWRPLPRGARARRLVRFGRPAAAAAAVAGMLVAAGSSSPSAAQRIGSIAIFALAAAALAVAATFTGRLSFGHWAIAGVGTAVALLAGPHLDYLGGLALAMAATAAASVALALPFVRRGGFAYPVASLAFALGWGSVVLLAPALRSLQPLQTPRLLGLRLATDASHDIVVISALVLALAGARALRASRLGRAMLAARDNATAAEANGIAVTRMRVAAFAISGAMAGAAGFLYPFSQHLAHPGAFAPERSLSLLAAAAIGGLGSPASAALAAAGVQAATLFLSGPWGLIGSGLGLLLVLLIVPAGIGDLLRRARDRMISVVERAPGEAGPPRGRHRAGPATEPAAPSAATSAAPPSDAALVASDITVRFGAQEAVAGVGLFVRPGEVLAVLGTNGAGKTTLLRALAGIVRPARGSVSLAGRDLTALPPERRARRGLLFVDGSRPVFPGMTVAENLRMAAFAAGRRRGATLDLPAIASRSGAAVDLPAIASRSGALAGTLSGGEQRMLAIAQTLLLEPRVLLVDELSFGLSPEAAGRLWEMIRGVAAGGAGVVVVEHRLTETLALADRVIFMDGGTTRFEGTPAEFAAREDLLAPVLLDADAASALEAAR